MKLDIYVNYPGNCKQAFQFYEQHLGGKITLMTTFREMPDAANIPEERKDDILHARIEFGGTDGQRSQFEQPVRNAHVPDREPSSDATTNFQQVSGFYVGFLGIFMFLILIFVHPVPA